MRPVLAFDQNGTLLDLSVLDRHFAAAFGSGYARTEWFEQVIQSAMACTATGYFLPFTELADAALDWLAERKGRPLAADQKADIMAGLRALPAYADVRPALAQLRDAGFRTFVLTNSARLPSESLLEQAGIRDLFEDVLSVESVQRYKPAPEVYRAAADAVGCPVGELLLVAAHDWDTGGAIRAGARAAFLRRPGEAYSPIWTGPQFIATDMHDLARQLMAARW